jgi:hypothetical protein
MPVIQIKCDPAMFDGREYLDVTLPEAPAAPAKKKLVFKRPPSPKMPTTLGEEVEQLLVEWYAAAGRPMPADEIGIGARIDAEEAVRATKEAAEAQAAAAAAPEPMPEYGTPAFWAWARKRKAEKDAERAAAGLPPLPSKKEKEAAAAKAREEREAKKKEKEAAAAAKAAAKAAKAAAKKN